MLNKNSTDEWLPDSSGKHGEGLCGAFVPDLERIAGITADIFIAADSPKYFL